MYCRFGWIGNPGDGREGAPVFGLLRLDQYCRPAVRSGQSLQATRYRHMTRAASALIADIGATNARFALLDGTEIAVSETYAVADYASPIEAARHFLSGPAAGHAPKRALIAAAGPV